MVVFHVSTFILQLQLAGGFVLLKCKNTMHKNAHIVYCVPLERQNPYDKAQQQ